MALQRNEADRCQVNEQEAGAVEAVEIEQPVTTDDAVVHASGKRTDHEQTDDRSVVIEVSIPEVPAHEANMASIMAMVDEKLAAQAQGHRLALEKQEQRHMQELSEVQQRLAGLEKAAIENGWSLSLLTQDQQGLTPTVKEAKAVAWVA